MKTMSLPADMHRTASCAQIGGEVGLELIARLALAAVGQGRSRDRGVDDRDVDFAQIGFCGFEKAVDVFGDRQVDIDAVALADLVDALERVVQMFGGPTAYEDANAIACQEHRDRASDAGRAAGDDRLAAVKARPLGMRILFVDHFGLRFRRARWPARVQPPRSATCGRKSKFPPIEKRAVFSPFI